MRNNLINFAKGKGKAAPANTNTAKPNTVKKPAPKIIEKPKTKEEIRDEKVKETIGMLLKDVDGFREDGVKVNEVNVNEVIAPQIQNNEWLEEQVSQLTEECERLKTELDVAKTEYSMLFEKMQNKGNSVLSDETIKSNILVLFEELQNNLLGRNEQRTSWKTVSIEHVLNQMLVLFPITENYRRF
jgi:hypothetical protein